MLRRPPPPSSSCISTSINKSPTTVSSVFLVPYSLQSGPYSNDISILSTGISISFRPFSKHSPLPLALPQCRRLCHSVAMGIRITRYTHPKQTNYMSMFALSPSNTFQPRVMVFVWLLPFPLSSAHTFNLHPRFLMPLWYFWLLSRFPSRPRFRPTHLQMVLPKKCRKFRHKTLTKKHLSFICYAFSSHPHLTSANIPTVPHFRARHPRSSA